MCLPQKKMREKKMREKKMREKKMSEREKKKFISPSGTQHVFASKQAASIPRLNPSTSVVAVCDKSNCPANV